MKDFPETVKEDRRICLSPAVQVELREDSLCEKLEVVMASLPAGEVTVAELRDLFGQDGLLLLTIFLALVFMAPVALPGLSVVFGCTIVLIGICRIRGLNLWLPKRIGQRVMSADRVRRTLKKGSIWLHRLERVSRSHRLNRLASTGLAHTLNNGGLVAGALLLMAPIILVPFSNTLPALALLLLSIGMLQRDGLCILFGHLANLATLIYFSAFAIGGGTAIHETFQHFSGNAS